MARCLRTARLRDFFVIGAQKCGTTTLYEDLRGHPSIRLTEKERSPLLITGRDARRAEYGRTFRGVGSGARCGDVSTEYAMLPRDPQTAAVAASVNPHARVVYIVRDPLHRTLSHHRHLHAEGSAGLDFGLALAERPDLLDNSRYATQVRPWMSASDQSRC